jgi:tetratricopeptide (TPR) repeat protein
MFANAKKIPQAIGQYREILKIDGGNAEAMMNLSRCLVAANQLGEAKGYLKQAIAAEPDKGEPHSYLGDICLKNEHDTDAAILEYQAAIMVEQNNPNYYEQLAWALECKGRRQGALDSWKKAIVYIDDPMQKEDVKNRIDRLEKSPDTGGGAGMSSPHESTMTRRQTEDLERQVRSDSSREGARLKTTRIDISGDLDQLNADTTSWDLNKELNKRTNENKSMQTKSTQTK